MFFAYGMAHALMGALRFGTTIVVYEGNPDGAIIAAIIERYSPTIVATIPTLYRNMLRDGFAKRPCFKNVRVYLSSGEGLPAAIYDRWLEETGVVIFDGLGTTETIFQFMNTRPGVHRAGSCGKPTPYSELKLVHDDGNVVVTPDTRGMAWVKMDSVCMGYWNQPERTAAAFRDGWFLTGDVFSFDAEGWWHHHGRGDDQLKISGQWVNPMEIEEQVVAVPGVADAAVIGVPDEDGLVRLNLFVVPNAASTDQLERTIQNKLLSALSIYKCPRRIRFVNVIPRTATGKLQRYRLRQEAADASRPRA
jgi:benzoate-CoA ligase